MDNSAYWGNVSINTVLYGKLERIELWYNAVITSRQLETGLFGFIKYVVVVSIYVLFCDLS